MSSIALSSRVASQRVADRSGPRAFLRALFSRRQAQLGGIIILGLIVCALFAPLIAPYDPTEIRVGKPLQGPSRKHLFGTDDLGRDLFSRIVYGSRITIRIGVIIVAIEVGIGLLVGLAAGYYGGWVSALLMRFTDVMLAFPGFLLAMAIVSVLGPGLTNAMIAVAIGSWPWFARVIRSSVLSVREMEYVTARAPLQSPLPAGIPERQASHR